jgi:dihydropyrimidinase
VLLRGALAMQAGKILASPGRGRFLPRDPCDLIRPTGRLDDGFDAAAVALHKGVGA